MELAGRDELSDVDPMRMCASDRLETLFAYTDIYPSQQSHHILQK